MSKSAVLNGERFPCEADVPPYIGPYSRFDADGTSRVLSDARHALDALLRRRSVAAAEFGKLLISEMAQNAERHGGGLQAIWFAPVEVANATEGLAVFALDRNLKPATVEPKGAARILEGIHSIDEIDVNDLPENGWSVDVLIKATDTELSNQIPTDKDTDVSVAREGQIQTGNGNVLWAAFKIPESDATAVA